jgi:hypothetical protein
MSLSREQRVALTLAGTVALPSPFPCLGELRLSTDIPQGYKATPADLTATAANPVFLSTTHRISPKLRITRFVNLEDVSAVFLPDCPSAVSLNAGTWLLPAEVRAETLDRLNRRPTRTRKDDAFRLGIGIIYVAETANVLMQVEVGMTAAESAEYYPPLPGEKGSNYHDFCDAEHGEHGDPKS